MNKKCLFPLIGLVILSSCGSDKTSSKNNISSSSSINLSSISSNSSSSISSSLLPSPSNKEVMTPSLLLDEQTGVVTWEKDENADYYNYIINDGEVKTTTSNTITLIDQSNISVQAVNDISISEWSSAVTFFDTSDVIVSDKENVNIYFHNTTYTPFTIKIGNIINKPDDPVKANYIFDNWYKDPFYQELFDFSKPIYESTIIYANYTPSDLVDNVYFWIKASPKITSSTLSSESNSGWHFIPLHVNESQTDYKEFKAVVSVSGATSIDPAKFLIMDGFDDNAGRTYWKNNGADFTISSDGTYTIYFSLETQYKVNNNVVHAKYEQVNSRNNLDKEEKTKLQTPFVNVDLDNDIARWDTIENAENYEVIIDNNLPRLISENYISLDNGSHISVRALSNNASSNWSIPKANLNYIVIEESKTHSYVYFLNTNETSIKVENGTYLENNYIPEKEGFTFKGWYLDISLKKMVVFPYLVTENTVLYPKWEFDEKDYQTKYYYKLVDTNNNIISGLTWNLDNYDFYEYNTAKVNLNFGETYYIKTIDDSKTWGPYKVSNSGSYVIYFSEDHIWNINTENASNVYIAEQALKLYFSNANSWSGTIYAYAFEKSTGDYMKAWPGSQMTYVKTNSYGQDIYSIEVDTSKYDYIIFTNGTLQTIDISLSDAYSGMGYYTKSEKDGNNYKVGTYKFE